MIARAQQMRLRTSRPESAADCRCRGRRAEHGWKCCRDCSDRVSQHGLFQACGCQITPTDPQCQTNQCCRRSSPASRNWRARSTKATNVCGYRQERTTQAAVEGETHMIEWLYHLPVVWMALVVFLATALV